MSDELDLENLLGRTREIDAFYGTNKSRRNMMAKTTWLLAKFYLEPAKQVKGDMIRQMVEVIVSILQMVNGMKGEDLFKKELLARLNWMEDRIKDELNRKGPGL